MKQCDSTRETETDEDAIHNDVKAEIELDSDWDD